MTIQWNKDMKFDGKNAVFSGGVQGEQDNSTLKCVSMTAVMDRTVVFKDSQKSTRPVVPCGLTIGGGVRVRMADARFNAAEPKKAHR